jgi:glycosyltransferase involved in cell wall biosynthesis
VKISVIVPVYNSSKYLQETLNSIESQTYKNIELFVIDNESTDNSYEIVQKFKNETKKI